MSKLVSLFKVSGDIFYSLCIFNMIVCFFSLYFNHYGLFQTTMIIIAIVYLINICLFSYIMNKYRLSYRKLLITYSDLKGIRSYLETYKIGG
jgi:hypothetical protein